MGQDMKTANPEAGHPPAASPGSGLGIERSDGSVVCAACGYEAEWTECGACGGEGGHDGYEEDPLWYNPGELAPCTQCSGTGGEWWCENAKCETQNIWKLVKAPNNKVSDGCRPRAHDGNQNV